MLGFNLQGFGIVLLVVVISLAIVFVGPVLKKFFPRYRQVTNTWFFGMGIGLFCLIGLIVFRFADAGHDLSVALEGVGGDYHQLAINDSNVISKAGLLDACPFCAFFMCVLLIVDPTRKAARSLSPLCFIGGLITIFSLSFTDDAQFTAQYIFIGDGINPCYCIMHTMQVLLALAVGTNTPSYGGKGGLAAIIATGLFYSYVGIMMAATGAHEFVSGLSIDDGDGGEYHFVSEIFGGSPKVCSIIGIPTLGLVGCGIVAIKDYVFSHGIFKHGNAYSGKGYQGYNYNKFVKQRIG